MAQERHIKVQVSLLTPAFSGVVFTPETGWQEGPGGKTSVLVTAARIGRFTPKTLGRTPTKHSRVRVYCDGPVIMGDTVEVKGSNVSTEAAPVSPTRTAPVPLTTSLEDATVLELGPTDDLLVNFAGDGTLATIHIVIYDLSEEELERRDNAWFALNAAGQIPQFETRVVNVNSGSLASWTGTLFVSASAAAVFELLYLPPLADVAIGDKVTIFRDDTPAGVSAQAFNVLPDGAETINGSTDPVRFIVNNMGATFERTSAGWAVDHVADSPAVDVVAGDLVIPRWATTLKTIAWDPNGAASKLTLPSFQETTVGQALVVYATAAAAGVGRGFIVPAAGERINGVVDFADIGVVGVGDAVYLFRITSGWLAIEYTNRADRSVLLAVLDPLFTVGWRGRRYVQCTYAAPGNFTLPPAATTPLNCELLVWQTNASTVTVLGNGSNIVAGGTSGASKALAQNAPVLYTFTGSTGWIGV